MYVETKKIYEFAGAVNLGLVGIFALAQHSGTINMKAIFSSQKIGGF